jgi:CheY-like chemotaxis protein
MSRLLLVDDQAKNLIALEAALRAPHRELVSVQSGEHAIEEVRRRDFAVVVLDVVMPRMDGLETAIALRSLFPQLPIIFLSAYWEDEDVRARARAVGAHEYMMKPFDRAVLCGKIAHYESA